MHKNYQNDLLQQDFALNAPSNSSLLHSVSESKLTTLSIDLLAPSPFQPRKYIDPQQLEELSQSIKKSGVLQPLLARSDPNKKGYYQIIAGERRWRAAQKAGLHLIPVHILPLSETESMTAAIVENLQRSDLDPMEEAEGLHRLLHDYHFTQEELAKIIGKSRAHLTNILRLLNAPDKIKHALKEKKITAGHARALLGHPMPLEGLDTIIKKGLNVRQAEALVQNAQKNIQGKNTSPLLEKNCDITDLEEKLTQHLGMTLKIKFNGKDGHLKINYSSLDQLEYILNLLKK